ncbi:uncharacterized protein LOC128211053 isoform X3 [Mya arenaria]|uniref:uncharacterized protein LOC128211053 isoform X3 n=1 Tax=Mya arenaria TaxID=6604 RepID=UPI0022E245E6|nr:uncharacterized protein LOC128211053 isoform X3 [Mya arenaria]
MSESTPGSQQKGVAREDYSSQEDSQQMQSGILSRLPGDRPTNNAPGNIDENKNTRADNSLAVAPSASFVVQHRGQENAGNGEKGSQSVVCEASDMHDDLTNLTAMQQRKTGSSGNLRDDPSKQPVIKEDTVTAEESVVELQQVNHSFYDRDNVIEVDMHVWKVDKDSLVVNFCPDTVHVTFQTRDAQFLKLYKGSTEKTKFIWTIKLKGQAQEDKCSFQVYSCYVYLKITKKVSGRWGDLENLKRTETNSSLATQPESSGDGENKNADQRSDHKTTASSTKQLKMRTVDDKQGTNPASDLQATQQNSSGGEGNRNAKPILDAKMTASSADSSTVDNKEAIHPQSSGDERNVEQRPHPKTTAESAYSSTKQPEMSLVADKEDTADVKDFLGSQDSISSIESFIIINPKEADCKEQEKIEHKTQSEFPPAGTSFECMNSKQSRSKSEAAHLEKPVSNDKFCIKYQGSIPFVLSIDNPMCLLSLGEAKNAYFEGDLLCVDGRLFVLITEGNLLKSNEVPQIPSDEQNGMALCKDSSFVQEKDKSVKEYVAKQGNTRDMLEQDHAVRPTTRQHSLDNSSAFGSQSVVKQKRKEIVRENVPTVVVKIISQSSFKSKFRTKFPDDEYKVRNEKSNTADIIITGSLDCFEWFEKEIHYCQITFNEVKNSSIPKLPDIVENYLSNRYGK